MTQKPEEHARSVCAYEKLGPSQINYFYIKLIKMPNPKNSVFIIY